MPQSQIFTTDSTKTLAKIMNQQQQQPQQIPSLQDIGNQKIPTKLIDNLLKKQTKPKKKTMKALPVPQNNSKSFPSNNNNTNVDISKEDLITKILNYENSTRFGAYIKKEMKINFSREQLSKKSLSQLEALMYRIRTSLNSRHMEGVYDHFVKTIASGYENVVTSFGYDITGFQTMLLNNPAFWDAFEMWKLERKLPEIPPSLQLMYIISSTTFVAHLQTQSRAVEPRQDKKKTQKSMSKQVKKKQQDVIIQDKEYKKTQIKVGSVLQ